jgi:hypothetical protein
VGPLTFHDPRNIEIFGLKEYEEIRDWRKLHHEELHHLYSSPNIIGTIESRRMRWAGYEVRMGRGAYVEY